MDEANVTKVETDVCNQSKASIELLREAKPSRDISINSKVDVEATGERSQTEINGDSEVTNQSSSQEDKHGDSSKIETVFEKLDMTTDKTDSTTDSTVSGKDKDITDNLKPEKQSDEQPIVEIPPLNFEVRARSSEPKTDKNSDNLDPRNSVNSLYSVKGSPSGRINRRREMSSTVFPIGCMGCKENPLESKPSPRRFIDAQGASNDCIGHINETPRKKPSTEKSDMLRNPVTGEGILLSDSSRRQCIRRKDGNPVLGTGYGPSANTTPTSSTGRIPPGGYSQGLW